MELICKLYKLIARTAIVALLLKTSLEIIIINKETPKEIVNRSNQYIGILTQYAWFDQDSVSKFIMLNQESISRVYGSLLFGLSSMVAFCGCRCSTKMLIALVLFSIAFFNLELGEARQTGDFTRAFRSMISEEKLDESMTLMAIVAGLFLIDGYSTVSPAPLIVYKEVKGEDKVSQESQQRKSKSERKAAEKEKQLQKSGDGAGKAEGQKKKKKNK